MNFNISSRSVEKLWDSCLDIGIFTGIGYLSGRIVNQLMKWTSKPSLFGAKAEINLRSAATYCGLFMLIDRIAQSILIASMGTNRTNKPAYSMMRMGLSAAGAIALFNAAADQFKLVSLETKMAGTIILTAVFVYSRVLSHLNTFNNRP